MKTDTQNPTPVIKRLLMNSSEAAESLGLSKTAFYAIHSSGRLGVLPVKLTRNLQWPVAEMEAWVAAGSPPRDKWQAMKKAVESVSAAKDV